VKYCQILTWNCGVLRASLRKIVIFWPNSSKTYMFLHIIRLIFHLNPNSHLHMWQPCIKSCNQVAACSWGLLPEPYNVVFLFINNSATGQHHVPPPSHFIPSWYCRLHYFFPLGYCHFFLLLTTRVSSPLSTSLQWCIVNVHIAWFWPLGLSVVMSQVQSKH
jgi:hypothetical protein